MTSLAPLRLTRECATSVPIDENSPLNPCSARSGMLHNAALDLLAALADAWGVFLPPGKASQSRAQQSIITDLRKPVIADWD
jgi:hypothetical protein